MSNAIFENSRAAYEPFNGHFYIRSQHVIIMQSSSVTSAGNLWQLVLAGMVNSRQVEFSQREKDEIYRSTEQEQRNLALARLLQSRREGDEREQRETWEHLKRALDQDRLSERKLFP